MGRNNNQLVTTADLKWMEDNGMLYSYIPAVPSNRCVSAGYLRLTYNLDEAYLTNYTDRRMVPYQRIRQRPVFTEDTFPALAYTGGSDSVNILNYWGYSWTISWKLYDYYGEDTMGDWFNATPTSGTNAPAINMTFDYNDTPDSRRAVVSLNSGGQSYEINLFQAANPGVDTIRVVVSLGTTNSIQYACEMFAAGQNRFDYYIDSNYGWSSAPKLYSNIEGTTLAPSGFYSNGQRARYWNRDTEQFSIVGPNSVRSVACDTTTPPVVDPVYDNNMIILARYQTTNTAENACSMYANNVTQTYYIPNGTTWGNTPVIYTDIDGENIAPTGWYSNGSSSKLWIRESSSFVDGAACS